MAQQIGAPGQLLPVGQFATPGGLQNAPLPIPGNGLTLPPGSTIPVPPGNFFVDPGVYSVVQFLDPSAGFWRTLNSNSRGFRYVVSNGSNFRVANLLGCPVGAIVTDGGESWVQSTTTVTPSVGNSTWQAIVGGMLSVVSVASAGAGYGVPPLVQIAPPPAPGLQATGYATVQSGTVSGVTLTNVGGGYTSVPEVRLVPSPTDPNLTSNITNATVSIALAGGTPSSGSIAGIVCTNNGCSVASVPTLTIAGAGTGSPAATAVQLLSLTGATVQGAGTGYTGGAQISSIGGRPTATPLYTNPNYDYSAFIPRPAQGNMAAVDGSLVSVGAIYDGGLFLATPTLVINPLVGALVTGSASITPTMGTYTDTVVIQPA